MNSSRFQAAWLHASLRAEHQAQKRLQSLRSGEMDHLFHYVGARQAQLWLDVHRRHAPLFADAAFERIYRDLFARVAEDMAGRSLHVIGLGTGGGQKEGWLLEALRAAGCTVRYTPVDASAELAWLSAEAGRAWVSEACVPIVGDLSLLEDVPAWLDAYPADEPRLYTAIGISPNFLPSRLLSWLRGVLRGQDSLLLSANLAPVVAGQVTEEAYLAACRAVLPQYDNLETRRWLRQVLIDWGLAEALSEPVFGIERLEGIAGFVARSTWRRDMAFEFEGEPCAAQAGATLRLFFSLRYTPERLAETVRRHGLVVDAGEITPCRQEGVWRVRTVPADYSM